MTRPLLSVFIFCLMFIAGANAQNSPPTLFSPADSAKNQQPIVTCRWYADTAATYFTVALSTDSSFPSSNTNIYSNIKPTSIRLTGLKASTTYFWHVKAYFSGGDSSSFSDTFSFTTGDAPSAKISMSGATVCIYNTVNLSFTATGLAPIKYYWTFSGGSIDSSTSAGPNIYFITPGTYAVTLTLTNVFGSTSITEYIDVLDNLSEAKIVRSPGSTKCIDNEITLTAYPAGMVYTWSNGAKTQSVKIKDTGNYYVTVSNGACSSNAYIRIDYDLFPLKITPSTKYLCYKDSVKLDAGSEFISYKWNTGQTTQTIYAKHPGTYYLWAVGKDSCMFYGQINLKFKYDSAFRISVNGLTNYKICSGVVTLSVPKIAGLVRYKWSTGDTTTSIIADSATKLYSVIAEDANGCKAFTYTYFTLIYVKCMSGTYTIGGTNPDFKTIQDAARTLRENLIVGDITLNIRNGSYYSDQPINFDNFGMVNGNHKIVLQSESGDASKVKIYNTSAYGGVLYINTPNLSVNNLTIIRNGLYNIIEVAENANHVSFEGNIILDNLYSSPYTLLNIRSDNALISANTFIGGSNAIVITNANDAVIEKNKFDDQSGNMINITKGKNIKISNNTTLFAEHSYNSYDVTGINLINVQGFVVDGNSFVGSFTQIANHLDYGIRMENCSNSDTTVPHVYNNIFSGSNYGVYLISSSAINIYHNNIYSLYRGIQLTDAYNIGLINNNIYNGIIADNNKYSFSEIKTNNYYPAPYSSNFIKEVNNLEGNSVSINPLYPSNDELYAKNKDLDKAGTVISAIDKDFHGQQRDMQNADIGAEELVQINDLALDSIYLLTEKCGFSASETLQFRIRNLSNIEKHTIPAGAGDISFGYKINNDAPIILYSNLSQPQTITYLGNYVMTYANKLNLATPGKYNIKVWVSMQNDSNRNNDTMSIVVNSKAAPKSSFEFSGVCLGNVTTFTNTTSYTGTEPQYTWVFYNGSKQTTKNASFVYVQEGTYSVKLISVSPSGCKDSVIKSVIIYSHPYGKIVRNGRTLTINTTTLPMFYQWLFNGEPIEMEVFESYVAEQDGKYSVVLTNAGGCKDTSEEYNYIYTGLSEENLSSKIEIYPNPTHGKTLITGLESKTKLNTINIYDVLGKCVYSESITNSPQNNDIELDLTSLKAGVYWLQLSGNQSDINKKIIIY